MDITRLAPSSFMAGATEASYRKADLEKAGEGLEGPAVRILRVSPVAPSSCTFGGKPTISETAVAMRQDGSVLANIIHPWFKVV